jgi:hypothetical protein
VTGHSSSTWGAAIDYWIGGGEVEHIGPEQTALAPHPAYSEPLVLLPGLGIVHEKPRAEERPTSARTVAFPFGSTEPFVINLAWSLAKLNHPHLERLKRIADQISSGGRAVTLRFLVINGEYLQTPAVLANELSKMLAPHKVESAFDLTFKDYLDKFQQGHLFLGSHPYGDCNTVMDALVTQTPMVLWEGKEWRNRIGPAMLRRAGLSQLIASSEEAFVAKAVSLALHGDQWTGVVQQLGGLDLDALFYQSKEGSHYPAVFKALYVQHAALQAEGYRVLTVDENTEKVVVRPLEKKTNTHHDEL